MLAATFQTEDLKTIQITSPALRLGENHSACVAPILIIVWIADFARVDLILGKYFVILARIQPGKVLIVLSFVATAPVSIFCDTTCSLKSSRAH